VKELISFEEAQSTVLQAVAPQPVEHVPLADVQDRTLAETIVSQDAIPPFDNSARDGFAVRASDLEEEGATLEVVDHIPAGTMPDITVRSGTCASIMTGAPMPEGADAAIPVEWTTRSGNTVTIDRDAHPGLHVRPAGQDVAEGETMFEAGTKATPPVVGMLATLGVDPVPVRVPPVVAVLTTGDELVAPSSELGPGQIRNANGPALAAQVRHAGGQPMAPLHAPDDADAIQRAVEEALQADLLVFSGGVSVGEHDLVKEVLDAMGMRLAFWKVKQRPGKPLAFGTLQDTPVLGLPGNPVSSAMCFEQYVRPALAMMLGRSPATQPRHPAVLEASTPKVEALHHFARGHAFFGDDGRLRVRDTGPQASNLYSSVTRANSIIHLPAGMTEPEPGTSIEIEWLPW
jgi:molybdopterin molybdotransferase